MRNKEGEGPFAARISVFYTTFTPRLDTFPTYIIENGGQRILPGFVTYKNLVLKGISIDYSYSLVRLGRLRLDLGAGVVVGKYRIEYYSVYKTVINSHGVEDELLAGLRPKLDLGLQINRYVELFGEYKYNINTSLDWARQFGHNAIGAGLNITLNPVKPGNEY
jgi:hypothetical protein